MVAWDDDAQGICGRVLQDVLAGTLKFCAGVEPTAGRFRVRDDPVSFVVGVGGVAVIEIVPRDNFWT